MNSTLGLKTLVPNQKVSFTVFYYRDIVSNKADSALLN